MKISIIICTYNRAEILCDCLNSLTRQTAHDDYEVIIVDNNSNDETKNVYESLASQLVNPRYIIEETQGLSHARNRGYKEALSDWVLYLDDDTKVFDDFIERAIYVTENYNFDCFGGIFLPWYRDGKPKWFPDKLASNKHLMDSIGTLENGFATGCVIAFRKSALIRLGGFPTNIGMTGKKVAYGEETQLQIKIRENGGAIGLDPELRIYHLIDIYKQTPLWFIKKYYASGRDSWETLLIQPTLMRILNIPLYVSRRTLKNIFFSTLSLFKKDYYLQNWVIDVFCLPASGTGKFLRGIQLLNKTEKNNAE